MGFDSDIQNPCVSCGQSHARHDGLCTTCREARELPYTCDACHGTGVHPMIRVGLRVVRAEQTCAVCDGRGRVSQERAVTDLAYYAIAVCRTLDSRLVPPQLSEARELGDERLLGFWRRVLVYVCREQSRQAWWNAVIDGAVA